MNSRIYIIIFLFFSLAISQSCKNSKKKQDTEPQNKKNDTTAVDINSFNYNIDSTSEDVAVLVIRPDGESEYIINKPDKIFQKTKSGLEYKYIISGKSRKYPKVGDVVYITMNYATENDSIIFRSKEIDNNFKMRLIPSSHPGGSIEEAFSILSEGDSAIFKIDAVNFLTYTQKKAIIPEYVKPNDKFTFYIKMNKIMDGSEFVQENSDIYNYYLEQEKSLIERLILELNFPRTIKQSGLNIVTLDKGNGKKVQDGNVVTINYTASFIDGTVFDSTIERNKPFRFVVGKDEVIEGLEEGVKSMSLGDHSIFIIPFRLAYGETKHGIIPPFSTLIFEVELVDVQ